MPLEVASYISQLNASYPDTNDDVEDGDNHLRLLKAVLVATLGGLAGTVHSTHAQLNYLRYVDTTNAPVLATNLAGFAVGPFSGQHLAFGAGQIQAKNATSATTLELNKLGGAVNIGPQSGSGAVTLFHSGTQNLLTMANGVTVKDGDGATPTVNLANSGGVVVAQLISNTNLYLYGLVAEGQIVLSAKDINGEQKTVFSGDPDGLASMYYQGNVGVQAANTGALVYSSVGDTAEIGLYQDDKSTRNALISAGLSGLAIYQQVHGAPVQIYSEDEAGVPQLLFSGDPDGSTNLYADGSLAAQLTTVGLSVFSTTNDAPELHFYRSNKSTRNGFLIAATTGMSLVNEVAGTALNLVGKDEGGNSRTLVSADPDGAAALYYNGDARLRTANYASLGSAAEIVGPDGGWHAVGLLKSPIAASASSVALRVANMGSIIRLTSSASITLDTTTDLAGSGASWSIENASGGNISITPTGVNLVWLDGSAGPTGARVLAPYGFASIYEVSSGNYRVVGAGLS